MQQSVGTDAASASPPRILARASGVALLDRGDGRLHFVRYLHPASGILGFLLLFPIMFLLLPLPLVLLGAASPIVPLGVHVPLAAATAVACVLAFCHLRRRRAAIAGLPAFCSIDPRSRMLTRADGGTVGGPVSLATWIQLASSSPKLIARLPGGRAEVIVRGDPFLGGMRPLGVVLRQHGLLR